MIDDLKPYTEYKESHQPWLGKIPSHWQLRSLRTFLTARNFRNRADLTLLSVVREKGVIPRAAMSDDENRNYIPDDLSNYKVVRKGNLVINKMKAWQGSLGIAPCDGIVSPAYYVFDIGIPNSAFAHTLLRSRPYVWYFARASDGVRIGQWDLSISGMREIPVVLPEAEEQNAIVCFLTYANRKFEQYVRAKKKLIALLNEQKQTIIQRAVKYGLNGNTSLKPSGNTWLGDLPAHWEQHALWTLSKLRTERNSGNLPLLSVFLDRGVIQYEEGGGQVHAPSLDLSNYQVVHQGDFVLNNQQAWRGSVGVSQYRGIVSPAYIVLNLSKRLNPIYANYLMRSPVMVDQFVAASKGVGDIQRQIYWPYLRTVQVPLPPLDEQEQIVTYLDSETRALNSAILRTEREIALIWECRTRLIADVVTGKVDVRVVAAKLSQEASIDELGSHDISSGPDIEDLELANVSLGEEDE
jgi:type I restriction enzyme, S subunit